MVMIMKVFHENSNPCQQHTPDDDEAACRIIEGTARSMGIEVV